MKKIISIACVVGLLGSTSLYAQSKKEIIANQQNQIQAQQHQLDSLRIANAYLQGYQAQLAKQASRSDSLNCQLQNRCLQLQHQTDSLSMVVQNLQAQVEQQSTQLREQKKEQEKQAAAKKEQAAATQKQQEQQAFEDMLAEYHNRCQPESALRSVFRNAYNVDRFAETKTALLDTYDAKCQAGKAPSIDKVKWQVRKNEGLISDRYNAFLEWHKHQYAFIVECPNGRAYLAYQFCFETHYEIADKTRLFSGFVPCQEEGTSISVSK